MRTSGGLVTLVDHVRDRQERQPDRVAYRFLVDGESEEETLTYRELDRRVRAIGAALQAAGLRGERALLLYPPGLDYVTAFLGCLYAGVVAVPAYPPRSVRHLPRLRAILEDADARVALTTGALLAMAQPLLAEAQGFPQPSWIATDDLSAGLEADWKEPGLEAGSLAFLQYTSGSTRSPRGVMLSHANLLHNLGTMAEWFRDPVEHVVISWLPPYHDMGLIGSIMTPLYGGYPAVLMSPLHFLERPYRWLRAITRYRGTASAAPNFAYDLCVRKVPVEQRAELDLSSWLVAVNGAEPVLATTVDRFVSAFGAAGFRRETLRPSYGLAEATLLVSGDPAGAPVTMRAVSRTSLRHNVIGAPASADDAQHLVGCGRPVGGQRLAIVDAGATALAAGRIGEVWVAGPSVADGYWGRPAEAAATFQARLRDDPDTAYLRTEDLGFVDDEGRLFITGRSRDLIILRGRNHYPHDVEVTVQGSHPALRPGAGAAFTVPIEGEERLVVVNEIEDANGDPPDPSVIADACRSALLDEHEIDLFALVVIAPRSLPKTSSGKVQRRATREEYLAGRLSLIGEWHRAGGRGLDDRPFEAPRTPLEALLAGVFGELLDRHPVGVHDDFFAAGGQSLLATQLVARIQEALPVTLTLGDIFTAPTVATLADLLSRRPLTADRDQVDQILAGLEAGPAPPDATEIRRWTG